MSLETLLPPVRRALEDAGLFRPGARLLCAVSGGADSVALLHALCALRAEGGFWLEASHVQHGLRGESSQEDERFVRALCRGLGTPLHVRNAGLCGGMDSPGAETRARDRRRSIFLEQMEALSMDALMLGHHLDDQAETVLMRLARGAGADGLRGMRPAAPFGRGVMLRPFLGTGKRTILEALAREGLPHREDGSNQLPLTPRNALRLEVMPALERLFPGTAVPAHAGEAVLSPEILRRLPVLRRPLPGDWIVPLGAPGKKPLRRFLSDRGVDAPLRPYLTVLADGKEILWIPFLCASERLRLSAVPEGSVRLRAASGAFDDEQK